MLCDAVFYTEGREDSAPYMVIYIYICARGTWSPPPSPAAWCAPPAPPVGVGFGNPLPPCGCEIWDLDTIAADISTTSCQNEVKYLV